jgi:methylthioribose-1-phosphate isomerase
MVVLCMRQRWTNIERKIRGAPAIASLAALALASHLSIALKSDTQPGFLASPTALRDHVLPQLNYLYSSRPTAVNLGAATRRLQNTLQAGLDAGHTAADIAAALIKEGRLVADEDLGRNRQMSKHGAEWLVERIKAQGGEGTGLNVMTVCNTGSLATSVRVFLCFEVQTIPIATEFRDMGRLLVSSLICSNKDS